MAKSAIGNMFRRRAPLPPAVAEAIEQLGRLAETAPQLGEAAALQAIVLRTLYAQPPAIGALQLAPERAAAKLRAGTPLLHGENIPIDIAAVEAALRRLAQAIAEQIAHPEEARAIGAAIAHHTLPVAELVRQALGGSADLVREQAAAHDMNGELLGTLLRFSLFPALTQLAAELAPLRQGAAWAAGTCPTCGRWPLLGEHRGLEQLRFLRCGLCASEWQVDRLLCPFCGTREHDHLSYLHVEGADHQRAVTCEQCRGYLKVLASLAPLTPLELLVQDIATLHLDLIAIERGYGST